MLTRIDHFEIPIEQCPDTLIIDVEWHDVD